MSSKGCPKCLEVLSGDSPNPESLQELYNSGHHVCTGIRNFDGYPTSGLMPAAHDEEYYDQYRRNYLNSKLELLRNRVDKGDCLEALVVLQEISSMLLRQARDKLKYKEGSEPTQAGTRSNRYGG